MKFRNYQNRTTILIPMRALNEGKSRLSNVLSPSSRSRLVELLFSQLLKKLHMLRCQFPWIFSDVVVITPCKKVKDLSEEFMKDGNAEVKKLSEYKTEKLKKFKSMPFRNL